MKRIKQLSAHLINQIAAGEVIERPASVVKELVENSIDAGATKISVEIANECRDLRIADNGSGIHPDDIMLAFSKHATSKISSDEDLFEISTLGFRGEALSSIISISQLTCTTRTKDFEYGTKVTCQNSEVKKTNTGCAVGTIMEVKNLFYNLPARLKFLRNPKTEFSYIQELVQALALANPSISFELKNNGKQLVKTNGLGNLKITIKEVYSQDVVDHLKEVLKTDKLSNFKISGFVTTPNYTRSSKKGYHIYINSRTVKCPVFLKSIDNAYRNLIGSGKYPIVVLNLEIPPTDVDVNVHPTKKEVRYKNTNQVFNFIYSAIDLALSNSNFAKMNEQYSNNNQDYNRNISFINQNTISNTNTEIKTDENDDDVVISEEIFQPQLNTPSINSLNYSGENESSQNTFSSITNYQPEIADNIIGQYKNTYILIEKDNGLEIVDQHIAEERYIYEQLKAQKQLASQLLFISDILDISASESELLKHNKEKFEKFGYKIDFLKENQVIFRKVPQMLSKVNPKELLSDILENLSGNLDGLEEKILIMTSCKSAIKAGQKLSLWQMQDIIKKWRTCKKPYTCPHGRPISKIISHKQIASFFERNE